MDSRRVRIGLSFATIYLIWGSTYFAMAVALEGVAPMTLAAARFVLAGVLVSVLARARGARLGRGWLGSALVPGLLFFTCGNGAVCWAESRGLPTSVAATLVASVPLWVAVLDRWFGDRGQALSWPQRLGLLVGFAGTAMLVGAAPQDVDPLATVVVASGAIAWASGSVMVARRARRNPARNPTDAIAVAGAQMLAGGLGCALGAVALGEPTPNSAVADPVVLGAFAYLVVFGSIVGFLAYGFLLRNVAAPRVATYAYVNPVVALVIGLFMGEPLEPTTLGAMALVVVAVAVTVTPSRPRPAICEGDEPRTMVRANVSARA